MLKYKSSHNYGLDFLIYNKLKNLKLTNNIYMYIWDYASTLKDLPLNFYNNENNNKNTYNYNLKHTKFNKINATLESVNAGFGNSLKFSVNDRIVIKPIDHIFILPNDDKYQTHEINHEDLGKYDKNIFHPFKLLQNQKGGELNIFVFRNLNTQEIILFPLMRVSYLINGCNIKKNTKNSWGYIYNLDVEFEIKFKNFLNLIKFDYGRIELIQDDILGWCIIDVNNSPSINTLNINWYLDNTKTNKINDNVEYISNIFKDSLY
jgi:hypothetical protein